MTKRLIGRGLVLLLCAIAALGLLAAAALADGGITTWDELQAAVNAGGRVTLTQDLIDQEYVINETKYHHDPITIPGGVTVTLDLNGYQLARKGEYVVENIYGTQYIYPRNSNILIVSSGATLILEDSAGGGMLCGSHTAEGGAILNYGTTTMNGGSIANNWVFHEYSGAGITNESGGVLTINGGSICNNSENYTFRAVAGAGGIFNKSGGVLNLNGGVITGNWCTNDKGCGGIWNEGTINVQGSPAVYGNNTARNIHLSNGNPIHVVGELVGAAHLGILCDKGMIITDGYSEHNSTPPGAFFESDRTDCSAVLTDDGEAQIVEGITQAGYMERSWSGGKVVSVSRVRQDIDVFPNSTTVAAGWYYLNDNVTVDSRVSLEGDTSIILRDGKTLDVKGLYIPQGSTLTIYGQSAGTGKIYSHPGTGAGIGGKSGSTNGSIVIHGGIIEATGADHCAGIGTNDGKTGGAITIYGGTITAIGGEDGAAIGGGRYCDGGTITIYGGNITANGPTDSDCEEDIAGIGGGYKGAGGNITIYGGTITTYSRDGAGIGGGDDGAGGTITIYGGNITSTKVNNGQGARIGGGSDAAPGTIAIHGGTITTVGGKGAGIGGGKGNKSGGSVTIDGGVISASGSYGIGSGEDGADVTITLGHTDATKETISITASSFNGSVTLEKPFAIYSSSQLFPAGAVSDNSLLSGGALTALRSRVSTWEQLRMALEYGGSFVVTGDITASENDSDLIIPNGVTAELDLQGHSVDASALRPTEDIWTCCLSIAGSFTLSDTVGGGGFSGGDNGFTDFILMEDGSGFTMNGGTVTGSGTALEDIVYVNEDSVFIMNGGAIIADLGNGESTLGHIYVASNGSFTMNGGTVSGSGGKADVMICGGSFLLNGGSLVCSGQEYGNVYVAFHNGISSRFAAAGSPRLTAGVYLTRGRTITVAGPLGEGVIIPVMTEATPTGFSPVTITKGLAQGGENAVAHFTSALDTCAVGLDEDGEAFLGEPVTVTFAPGYGTEETMESVSWAKDGWYPLPACGFSGPAGHAFAGWRVWEDAETVNAGDLINVSDGITLTAVWQVGAFGTPDFEIPSGTRTIEDNAFEGIAATVVEIPENCTSIGSEAFRYCTQLTMIRIPEGCALGADVFDGCTKVYVFGKAGSDAQRYCYENANCVFVEDAQD